MSFFSEISLNYMTPLKVVGDLQLGDQKVTLNHLVGWFCLVVSRILRLDSENWRHDPI